MPEHWRKVSIASVFIKGKEVNYNPVSLASSPGKVTEQFIVEVTSKHVEKKKIINISQHGFTKGKPCLTSLITFCDGNEGTAVDVVYPDFNEAFDTVSHTILLDKLRKCGLGDSTVGWIENRLNGRA